MFGIDPLTATTLLILAASGGGDGDKICKMPVTPKINVVPQAEQTKYDYSQTIAQLQQYSMDTIDPYGFHGTTATQGFMRGGVKLEPKIKFGSGTLPMYNQAACVWYESIDIAIKLDPTIVLAKEVYQDSCMRKAVGDHERKHVKIDRMIVNKYSKIMGRKVYDALAQRGFVGGPVPRDQAQALADRMGTVVQQVVEHEFKKMDLERIEKQRELDNLEEYESVNAKCPKFNLTEEMMTGAKGAPKRTR